MSNEAERRRRLVHVTREKTYRLLQNHEWGRAHLATLPRGQSPLELTERALEELFGHAMRATREFLGASGTARLANVSCSFLPREDVSATTEIFTDGSALVMVSDATLTLAWQLANYNRLPEKRYGSPAQYRNILAGSAAIRYYMHHQRTFGLSSIVGVTKKAQKVTFKDGSLSAIFILVHEIAHVALGHDHRLGVNAAQRKEWEFEADALAARILMNYLGPFGGRAVAAATIIAFCMLNIWDRGTFLRSPDGHPSTSERWMALSPMLGKYSGQAASSTVNVQSMTHDAMKVELALPQRCWEAMHAEKLLDTSIHSDGYYEVIRGLDMDLERTIAERDPLVRTLVPDNPDIIAGWEALASGGIVATARAWGASPDFIPAAEWLGYGQVVDRLIVGEAWKNTPDMTRRLVATLVVNSAQSEMRGTTDGA